MFDCSSKRFSFDLREINKTGFHKKKITTRLEPYSPRVTPPSNQAMQLTLFSSGDPSATVLVFFAAAAGTRFVATNFWQRTANGKIECDFANSVAILANGRHRANGLRLACECTGSWRVLAG